MRILTELAASRKLPQKIPTTAWLVLKVFGGTGILPVRQTGWKPQPKTAGAEARPTNPLKVYGEAHGSGTVTSKSAKAFAGRVLHTN
jgi:hypothetical protein